MERRPLRVFTFFLMLTVATVGTLAGYRVITGKDLLDPADFGLGQSTESAPPAATPRQLPTASPLPAPTPQPTQRPTPTPAPEAPQLMAVGKTDGQGVYLRRTPRMEDKLKAWRDGSRMEVIGQSVEGDGQKWRRVRAPDGGEGYIPEQYLVPLP